MARCVNENCNNNPTNSPNAVPWGCDFDLACNQHCYDEARKQMDHFCGNILTNDKKFASWLGVSEKWVKNK